MYQDNRIVGNKQNNARSGVEQPADLTKTFKILKRIQSEYTVSNVPVKCHPLKRIIVEEFNKLCRVGQLRLASNKRKALVDFLSNVPAMSTRAVTSDYIQEGFITPGVIDSTHRRYPDFDRILSTCKRDPTIEEYQLCKDTFNELFSYNFLIPDVCIGER